MKTNISSSNYKAITEQCEAFVRISKFLYNSIYVSLYDEATLREDVQKELGLLIRASLFMGRSFFQGRLWLIWVLNYLSGKGILEYSQRIKEECLRLYSRPDIIWDPCPSYIPKEERLIDSDGIVLATWLSNADTLERYKIQEWAITHIYGLERLLRTESKIHSFNHISASFLHSALYFLIKADEFNVFPFKVKPLKTLTVDMLGATGDSIDKTIGSLITDNVKKYSIPHSLDGQDLNKLSFFLFLYGIDNSDVENIILPDLSREKAYQSLEVLLLNAGSKLNNLK